MFQTLNGLKVYVVDLQDFPPSFPIHDGGIAELTPYAEALTLAITRGTITKPGKYAIHLNARQDYYDIFEVKEKE